MMDAVAGQPLRCRWPLTTVSPNDEHPDRLHGGGRRSTAAWPITPCLASSLARPVVRRAESGIWRPATLVHHRLHVRGPRRMKRRRSASRERMSLARQCVRPPAINGVDVVQLPEPTSVEALFGFRRDGPTAGHHSEELRSRPIQSSCSLGASSHARKHHRGVELDGEDLRGVRN